MSGRESETAMKELICIICPRGCHLTVDKTAADITVTGNACPRGAAYGKKEVTSPARVITSTVKVEGASHRRLPVKTNGEVPKGGCTAAGWSDRTGPCNGWTGHCKECAGNRR